MVNRQIMPHQFRLLGSDFFPTVNCSVHVFNQGRNFRVDDSVGLQNIRLTVDFLKFEYTVEHTREALNKLGSASARGIATSGFRKVNGSVDFFREDWTPETVLLSASGAALTLPIGSGVNGYSINIPVAQFRIPKDGEEGAAATVSAEFMAKETAGATTITKLA